MEAQESVSRLNNLFRQSLGKIRTKLNFLDQVQIGGHFGVED